MPSSSASSASPDGSTTASPPPVVPVSTVQSVTASIPAELEEGVANLDQNANCKQEMELEGTTAYNTQPGGDVASEANIWDIIVDSHTNLESYGDQQFDHEMTEPMSSLSSQISSSATSDAMLMASPHFQLPSSNLPPTYDDYQSSIDTSLISGGVSPAMLINNHSYSGTTAPNHYVTFKARQDGTPFPLSKPIVREDGLLLVGTEIVDPSIQTGEKNRIFVTNFLSSTGHAQQPSNIMVEQEVRDIQWMGSTQAAIIAVGKEIHLIQLGDPSVGEPCRLQDAINTVHSDAIRELAVSPRTTSYVLSGGFDETVVVTDLRNQADPKASCVVAKFDAYDVVSSVRWSPEDSSHLSWTTDGGDFQVADIRIRSPQLQVPLYSFVKMNKLGGLFTHEYLSSYNVALGFEQGHIALIDIRKPRQSSCTSLIISKLTATGEIRRSKSNKFAMFGRGGFSTADLNATADGLDQITLQQQPHQISSASYKTSGDFSYERGAYLAVSDNMSIVSVYTDDAIFGSAVAFNSTGGSW
ncbi:hypothetical protein PRIC1_003868 [Phytophthora ramorum]